MPPSPSQIASLTLAASKYMMQMSREAAGYLLERGIEKPLAVENRLGFIEEPEPGHEHMAGMLSIPYITRSGVVNIKTRCIQNHDCKEEKHPKYSGPHGAGTYLYNVKDLALNGDHISITEGEIDCLSLMQAGIPAVGVPGTAAWKSNPHWAYCFNSYQRVFIFADNDKKADGRNPGMDLAKRICDSIDNATIITLPENEDTNRCLTLHGAAFLREKVGLQ